MRLIDTKTLHSQEFTGPKVPRYAILSHTWGDQELTYQDWLYVHEQSPKRWGWTHIPEEIQRLKSTAGYTKVVKACEYARQHNSNCQWLWADTVCIDKSSSAELSEAINSMFEWYRRSEVCYALLVDVPPLSRDELARCSYRTSPFRRSRWFRRGWTLQELVAPWSVVFLSQDWTPLGTKSTLAKHIATITSIPESCLSGNWDRIREQTSIAQKMSWAAWRQTTRVEDQAYCLMGLFEINMPLLYGEGAKAFLRLQQEIIKQTADLSFLAWQSKRTQTFARDHFIHWELPTLAVSPSRFSSARHVGLRKTTEILATKRVFIANTGTFIHRPLLATLDPSFVFAPLNAEALTPSQSSRKSIWIPLVRDGQSQGFTRSSFPASTVFTALRPSRCAFYKGEPWETCLLPLYEPSSRRHYFRKGFAQTPSTKLVPSHRQVCILPVFASQSPWAEISESYPPFGQNDPLLLPLAEASNQIYHGIMIFRDRGSSTWNPAHFAAHFLVIFDHEGDRPAYWNVKSVFRKDAINAASPADLKSICHKVTDSILARASRAMSTEAKLVARVGIQSINHERPPVYGCDGDGGRYVIPPRLLSALQRLKRDPESLVLQKAAERAVFVEFDSHWYTFRSSGLEQSSFNTYVNLAMVGAVPGTNTMEAHQNWVDPLMEWQFELMERDSDASQD
ncbi:Heterokaryon incompatibility protein (HET) domain containing protein [Rhypophila sp. PSN 637]